MKDYAGKQYLEPPSVNTPADWALTVIALAICCAMLAFPIWAQL